jgi:hypothetical protein
VTQKLSQKIRDLGYYGYHTFEFTKKGDTYLLSGINPYLTDEHIEYFNFLMIGSLQKTSGGFGFDERELEKRRYASKIKHLNQNITRKEHIFEPRVGLVLGLPSSPCYIKLFRMIISNRMPFDNQVRRVHNKDCSVLIDCVCIAPSGDIYH